MVYADMPLLHAEFTSALCTETWFVADGGVAVSGGVVVPVASISASVSSLSLVSSKAGSASVASLTSLDTLVRAELPLLHLTMLAGRISCLCR